MSTAVARQGDSLAAAAFVAFLFALVFGPSPASADPSDLTAPPVVSEITVDKLIAGVPANVTIADDGSYTSRTCKWQEAGSGTLPGTWADIAGATSCSSYTPSSGDNAKWMRVAVTESNAEGSAEYVSRAYRLGGEALALSGTSFIFARADGTTYSPTIPAPGAGAYASGLPDLSPDGTLIAYQRMATSSAAPDIWVMGSTGGFAQALTDTPNSVEDSPRWSPDGSKLAYLRKTASYACPCQVVVLDLVTGVETSTGDLYDLTGNTNSLDWVDNDRVVLFAHSRSGGLGGLKWRYFKNWPGYGTGRTTDAILCPYVSGGQQCEFIHEPWVYTLSTGAIAQLNTTAAPTTSAEFDAIYSNKLNPRDPRTSPDGTLLIYDNSQSGNMLQFDLVHATEYWTTFAYGGYAWRSDGAKIFYAQWSAPPNGIYTANPDTSGPSAYATGGSWSPVDFGFVNPTDAHPALPEPQTFGRPDVAGNPTGNGGDPVNTGTGAFTDEVRDLTLGSIALPFNWTRSYNSKDTTVGDMGPGWVHSYGWKLTFTGSDVTVRSGSGQQVTFNGPSPYKPPAGSDAKLVTITGGYRLTLGDGKKYEFNTAGELTKIAGENGREVTLAYTGGNLDSITDTVGRVIDVQSTSGKISSVVLPDGRHVDYQYDGSGRLWKVTDARNKLWTYSYDGTSARLANVQDPLGHYPFRNTYDQTTFRVTSQLDALNNQTTYDWNAKTGVSTVTDPAGKVWKETYEGGALARRTDPLGKSVKYGYGENFNLVSVTDQRNSKVTMAYDPSGHLAYKKMPAPLNYEERWWYSPVTGRLAYYTNGRGKVTKFVYDANGNLTDKLGPRGLSEHFVYEGLGRMTDVTDVRQKTTIYTYNTLDQITEIRTPKLEKTTFTYDPKGRVQTSVEPRGNVTGCGCASNYTTTYAYDNQDRLTSLTDHLNRTTTYAYDDVGNLDTVTNHLNKVWDYDYNAANELTKETVPGGAFTTHDYDSRGHLSETVTPLGAKTTFTYDDAGRLKTMVEPLGNVAGCNCAADHTWEYGYDDNGNMTSIDDPMDHRTTFSYDRANRRTAVEDAEQHTSSVTYDENSNVVTATDGEGKTTAYSYDSRDRLWLIVDPRLKSTTFEYADGDLLTKVTDPLGNITTHTYDDDGRLWKTVEPRGNVAGCNCASQYTTTFTYDASGNLTIVEDALGKQTLYGYDRNGRRTSVTDPMSRQTQWEFDELGRTKKVIDPLLKETVYGYDDRNRLTSITDALSHVTTYGYDNDDRLTSVIDHVGNQTSFEYDKNAQLIKRTDANGNATPLDASDGITNYAYNRAGWLADITYSDATPDVTFQYDNAGNRTQMTDGAGVETYTYDNNDRLETATRGTDVFSYEYDENGNVKKRTLPDATAFDYGYDDANRLVSVAWPGNSVGYGYDPASNLTATTLPAANGYVETRTYDRVGRLREVKNTKAGVDLSKFTLTRDDSGLPTRIDKVGGGVETFQYEGAGRLKEVCYQPSCPLASDPFIRWTYDAVGNRLTENRAAGTTTYTYNTINELTQELGLQTPLPNPYATTVASDGAQPYRGPAPPR